MDIKLLQTINNTTLSRDGKINTDRYTINDIYALIGVCGLLCRRVDNGYITVTRNAPDIPRPFNRVYDFSSVPDILYSDNYCNYVDID